MSTDNARKAKKRVPTALGGGINFAHTVKRLG